MWYIQAFAAPLDGNLSRLRNRGTPVVVVAQDAGPSACSVSTDDIAGGGLAISHLLELALRTSTTSWGA